MPNWKKVITSGSDAELNKLVVDTHISASLFSGSFFGDASGLTGIAGGGSSVWYDGTTYITSSADVQITGSLNVSGSTKISLPTGTAFEISEPDKDQPSRLLFEYTNGDPTLTIASRASTAKLMLRQDLSTNGLTLTEDGQIYVNGTTSDGVQLDSTSFRPIGTNTDAYDLGANTRPWKDLYLQLNSDIIFTTSNENLRLQHINPDRLRLSGSDGTPPQFEVLEGAITASFFTGSFVGDGSGLTGIAAGGSGIFAATGSVQATTNDLQITGSLQIYKSGSTVFNIEGSQGTLFTVTDELSGSLFSVNDISGIPIFEVFSDDTVKIGTYNDEAIIVNGNSAIVTGSFTGSFTGDGTGLTGLFSVTNETNNYVITSTGASGGNGEANLTFDGTELGLTGDLTMTGGSIGVGVTPNATDGRIDASNDIVAYSSSDKRWKTNINTIESPLEKLQKLSGVEFDWIEDTEVHGNVGNDVGVIAQEVELVLPQAVQTRDSGMKAVRYEKLIPLLIETIKEQQKQIDELKNKIG